MGIPGLTDDPYRTLWLYQQLPLALLVGLWLSTSVGQRPWRKAVLWTCAAVIGGLALAEVLAVMNGALPGVLIGPPVQQQLGWLALAAVLATTGRRELGVASVFGGVLLGMVGGVVPAVVTLGLGVLEGRHRVPLALGLALISGAVFLDEHGRLVVWELVGQTSGLSIDATTVATAWVLGGLQLLGWGLALAGTRR